MKLGILVLFVRFSAIVAFLASSTTRRRRDTELCNASSQTTDLSQERIERASQVLAEWDKAYNVDGSLVAMPNESELRPQLVDAVKILNAKATLERNADSSQGRCMLGICAGSAAEGVATLKSWVNNLELPRGLLHGMDKDGVPIDLEGGVYIKYNSGGVYTFADVRKSQMGFDALWKPGDAMLEEYEGNYRGVYFQVELSDGQFRQYLVPLDLFGDLS